MMLKKPNLPTMRILILLNICLVALTSSAQQDWLPLAENTTSFFHNESTGEIVAMRADSVTHDSGTSKYFVWKRLRSAMGEGCDSVLLFGYQYQMSNQATSLLFYDFTVDSTVIINYSLYESGKCTLNISMLPGDTLPFNQSFFIVLDSTSEGLVLNNLDSLKHYSVLTVEDSSVIANIVLSKKYGLIEFVDFQSLNIENAISIKLIGLKNETSSHGLKVPDKSFFWSPEVGDKFLYKYVYSGYTLSANDYERQCTVYIENIVDSISLTNSEQIFYETNRYNKDFAPFGNNSCKFYSNAYIELLDSFQYRSGVNFGGSPASYYEPRLFWIDSTFEFQMYSSYIDCSSLFAVHTSNFVRAVKDYGFIHEYYNGGYFGTGTKTLYAAITSKGNYSNWPSKLGVSEHLNEGIKVYPNPGSGVFQVVSNEKIIRIKVFNSFGVLVAESDMLNIDLSSMSDGMYFFSMQTDSGEHMRRILLKK